MTLSVTPDPAIALIAAPTATTVDQISPPATANWPSADALTGSGLPPDMLGVLSPELTADTHGLDFFTVLQSLDVAATNPATPIGSLLRAAAPELPVTPPDALPAGQAPAELPLPVLLGLSQAATTALAGGAATQGPAGGNNLPPPATAAPATASATQATAALIQAALPQADGADVPLNAPTQAAMAGQQAATLVPAMLRRGGPSGPPVGASDLAERAHTPLGAAPQAVREAVVAPVAVLSDNAVAAPTIAHAVVASDTGPDTLPTQGNIHEVARAAPSAIERPALAPPPVSTFPLPVEVGESGWDQALGQRMVWMAEKGLGRARLRLDPPHLGHVQVTISMQDDQAQIVFQAQHPAAREALESALPKLREMFAEQGLELSDADVGGQDDQRTAGHDDDPSRDDTIDLWQRADEAPDGDDSQSPHSARIGRSMVDEYV